jgi:4a-hydroxytetrahydrobiopterin dehydratase|tara:strand:+ start:610 stop:858 length:249 start_codon:yes stop_codon:yes gene_type:complete
METPDGWELIDGRLMAEYEFEDFSRAKQFVDAVAELSELENHHPELHFGWGYVVLELFTHSVESVTQKDYDLAQKISQMTVE